MAVQEFASPRILFRLFSTYGRLFLMHVTPCGKVEIGVNLENVLKDCRLLVQRRRLKEVKKASIL